MLFLHVGKEVPRFRSKGRNLKGIHFVMDSIENEKQFQKMYLH